jgi:uncharacterized protein
MKRTTDNLSHYLKNIMMILLLVIVVSLLYIENYIPHQQYTNEDFKIVSLQSSHDMDQDGIDDQTDLLEGVKQYLSTKPQYQSRYYNNGYPDDHYGTCVDVVGFGLLAAGYDLMTLVNEDIIRYPDLYQIDNVDVNIDFRRVSNLQIYFARHAITLTTDINDINHWQAGDIVVFKRHIGIVADHRNYRGISFIFHHAHRWQLSYEEDILEFRDDIVGHYRISQ